MPKHTLISHIRHGKKVHYMALEAGAYVLSGAAATATVTGPITKLALGLRELGLDPAALLRAVRSRPGTSAHCIAIKTFPPAFWKLDHRDRAAEVHALACEVYRRAAKKGKSLDGAYESVAKDRTSASGAALKKLIVRWRKARPELGWPGARGHR